MAITNFSTLKTEVADFINRTDLAPKMGLFVQLAEATFNRVLRTADQQAEALLTITDGSAPLPADFAELVSVAIVEDVDRALQYVSPVEYRNIRARGASTGPAEGYTIFGGQIKLAPGAGNATQVRIAYFAKLASLSDSSPSNWLLERAPDAYLYGAAAQAMSYLKDPEAAAVYEQAKAVVLQALIEADRNQRYNGSPLVMRARPIGGING